jgi:hypothetical protein
LVQSFGFILNSAAEETTCPSFRSFLGSHRVFLGFMTPPYARAGGKNFLNRAGSLWPQDGFNSEGIFSRNRKMSG